MMKIEVKEIDGVWYAMTIYWKIACANRENANRCADIIEHFYNMGRKDLQKELRDLIIPTEGHGL